MKDHGLNKNSKLSDFMPEVDSSSIDQGWEKIKYFLPEEKKRRGFFFFLKTGVVLVTGVSSFLVLGIITFNYLNRSENHTALQVTAKQSKSDIRKEKKQAPRTHTFEKNISTQKEQADNKFPQISQREITQKSQKPASSEIPSPAQETIPKNIEAEQNGSAQEYKTSETALEQKAENVFYPGFDQDSISYQKLELLRSENLVGVINDSLDVPLNFINRNSWLQSTRGKISFEVFTGPNYTATKLNTSENNLVLNHFNFMMGVGINYAHDSKWILNGNFRAGTNKFNYEKETTGNKITGRKTQQSITSMAPDTVTRYVKLHSRYTVSSKMNYNFNLGATYNVFQNRRLSVGGSLQLSLSSSDYKITDHVYEESDTLNYIATPFSPGPDNILNEEPRLDKHNYKAVSLGLTPGILCNYQITSRNSVFFRASYFSVLTKNRSQKDEKGLGIEQRNVFIDLGFRWKCIR